jgi:hypothetical protein
MTERKAGTFDGLLTRDAAALERPSPFNPIALSTNSGLEDGKIKISPDAKKVLLITPSKGRLECSICKSPSEHCHQAT